MGPVFPPPPPPGSAPAWSAILTISTLKVAKHPRKQSIRESAKFTISPSSSSSSSSS